MPPTAIFPVSIHPKAEKGLIVADVFLIGPLSFDSFNPPEGGEGFNSDLHAAGTGSGAGFNPPEGGEGFNSFLIY